MTENKKRTISLTRQAPTSKQESIKNIQETLDRRTSYTNTFWPDRSQLSRRQLQSLASIQLSGKSLESTEFLGDSDASDSSDDDEDQNQGAFSFLQNIREAMDEEGRKSCSSDVFSDATTEELDKMRKSARRRGESRRLSVEQRNQRGVEDDPDGPVRSILASFSGMLGLKAAGKLDDEILGSADEEHRKSTVW